MEWFRSYHGAPTDPKWIPIAARTGTTPGQVAAVWWALMDHASQAHPRGSVADFDTETVAAFFGWPEDQVAAIVAGFRSKDLIADDETLCNWMKRQPKRERVSPDVSTERVQRFRAKQKEQKASNGAASQDETPRNARKRIEQSRGEGKEKNPSGSKRKPRLPETEIPADWVPKQSHQTKAASLGLDPGREAESFRFYHGAKGSLFRDWDLAFHTWLNNALEFRKRPPQGLAPPLPRLRREA